MPPVKLPVVQDSPNPARVSCLQCAKCCTYVAVGINAPTTQKSATEILWHLYHQGVSVCRDDAGEWYVQFEARCKNLGEGNMCAVYLNRPHICRAYDDAVCEVNAPQVGLIEFKEPQQFLEYLHAKKPKVYNAIAPKFVPPQHEPETAKTHPSNVKPKRASRAKVH
ncbi:MAG: YkgJ family cysteine cluster protein [Vicinamibacteria bacterium]